MSLPRVCCVEGCDTRYDQNPGPSTLGADYRDGSMGRGAWSVVVNIDGANTNNDIFVCNRHVLSDVSIPPVENPPNKPMIRQDPEASASLASAQVLPIFCRLCLAEDVQMVYPKDMIGYNQLVTKITECLQISVSVSEMQRSFICIKCNNALEQFKQFRTRCARQNGYLAMRRSLDPDRSQPLRYKENWYWYSCLGNNLSTVYWGCSVVCCPAFVITRPSGKICSNFAQHQHKQKVDDVKFVYCNGEYLYEGYRYSFDLINPNRTIQFSCRSLNDPYKRCKAILTCNDKSEVLSVGDHNHSPETILESAFKLFGSKEKRAVTLIRGNHLEVAVCLGFWYGTIANDSSISHWECIRANCSGSITLKDGVIKLNGQHNHQQVWLKWGAAASRVPDPPKIVMKIMNPIGANQTATQPLKTTEDKPQITVLPSSGFASLTVVNPNQANTTHESAAPIVVTQIKVEEEDPVYEINAQADLVEQIVAPVPTQTIVQLPPRAMPPTFADVWRGSQPLVVTAAAVQSTCSVQQSSLNPPVAVRSNHPIRIVKQPSTTIDSLQQFLPPATASPALKRAGDPADTGMPKIVHVMSLSKQPQIAQTIAPPVAVPAPISVVVSKTEHMDEEEPELITDEVIPRECTKYPSDPEDDAESVVPISVVPTVVPMALVASGAASSARPVGITALDSVVGGNSNNMSDGGSDNSDTATPEDTLFDLDDEEIPPIMPVDAPISIPIPNKVRIDAPIPMPNRVRPITITPAANRNSALQSTTALGNRNSPLQTAGITVSSLQSSSVSQLTVPRSNAPTVPEERRLSNSALAGTRRNVAIFSPNASSMAIAKIVKLNDKVSPKPPPVLEKPSPPLLAPKRPSARVFQIHGTTVKRFKPDEPKVVISAAAKLHANSMDSTPTPTSEVHDDPLALPEGLLEHSQLQESNSPIELEPGEENDTTADSLAEPDESIVTEETITTNAFTRKVNEPLQKRTEQAATDSSVANPTSKTVQLVKLQKSEQMLNFEGHLYKIKWSHIGCLYWDCMLREQVSCMAILETNGNDASGWVRHGMHNHKVPKPIANDDCSGKYQMFTAATGIGKVKRVPQRTLNISDIEEQKGKMMFLKKKRMFTFLIKKPEVDNPMFPLVLHFANYQYGLKVATSSGFRWGCFKCNSMLDTDEKFTVAKVIGVMHNHGPKVPFIDLAIGDQPQVAVTTTEQQESSEQTEDIVSNEGNVTPTHEESHDDTPAEEQAEEAISTNEKATSDHEKQASDVSETESTADELQTEKSSEKRSEGEDEQSNDERANDEPVEKPESSHEQHSSADEPSDDDEMVLDTLSGEFISRIDMKRKTNREKLLAENDSDDDETVLDPLTGNFCRKGDLAFQQISQLNDTLESSADEDSQSAQSGSVAAPTEDFEELLGVKRPKPKKLKKGSLAALKLEMKFQRSLLEPDPERNFEIIPISDRTCWIKYKEHKFQFERLDNGRSHWICALPPQYACRGRIELDEKRQTVSYPRPICALHSHVVGLQSMFDTHQDQEQGEIADTDQELTHKYTFYTDGNQLFQLLLDDGFLYSCSTISKSGISCWRCVSRQKKNCKANITMQGNFESLTRNRFNHAHKVNLNDNDSEDTLPKTGLDKSNDNVKNRKRQTL